MAKSKRSLKPVPRFASEAEERHFWETHDSAGYVDWSKATVVSLPNLKPSTETISLRLPAPLLSDLKALANKRDVPYQSLLKVFVADRVAEEWRSSKHRGTLANTYQPSLRQGRRSPPSGRRSKKTRDR
jgi:predicted DNA binding CopG/RHH family protein